MRRKYILNGLSLLSPLLPFILLGTIFRAASSMSHFFRQPLGTLLPLC